MKKILLSFLLIASVNLVFSQVLNLPCNTDYRINNGGGNCPDVNGISATGSVTLTFNGTVDPNHIPSIVSVTDITDPANPIPVTGVTFGPGTLLANGGVKYCYYLGPNNNNNHLGHDVKYVLPALTLCDKSKFQRSEALILSVISGLGCRIALVDSFRALPTMLSWVAHFI